MSEVDSGFTTKGFEEVPSLYIDNHYTMHDLAKLPESRLAELRTLYTTFLSGEPLEHHRAQAERFLTHLDFEERWRAGEWGDVTS